jgi:hypothetical protein
VDKPLTLHEKISLRGEVEKESIEFFDYTKGWNITEQERRDMGHHMKWREKELFFKYREKVKGQLRLF